MAMYRPRTDFHIPEPCSTSWDDMQGDARSRHCAACSRHVHNLAMMTPREIETLMAGAFSGPAHAPCVRMARFEDGSLLVAAEQAAHAPYGLVAGAVLSALVSISSVTASAQQQPTLGKMAMPTAVYSGRVLGVDGQPAAHVTVLLSRMLHGAEQRQEAETDASGNFRLSVQPGEWSVNANGAQGASSPAEPLKLTPGEHRAGKALQLQRVRVLAGAPALAPTKPPTATIGMVQPIKPAKPPVAPK